MDSKTRRKIREVRNIQLQMIESEYWKRKQAAIKEEKLKHPDPVVVRDTKRRQILQTISEAWEYAKVYKRQHKIKVEESEHIKIKKIAIMESAMRLVDLICEDVENLYSNNLTKESIDEIMYYYHLQINILESRGKEIGYNNILETINASLKEKFASCVNLNKEDLSIN